MRVIGLSSSVLSHVAFDPDGQRLFVHFKQNGRWWRYDGVDQDAFVGLLTDTVSHGRYFDQKIKKGSYPNEEVSPADYELHV